MTSIITLLTSSAGSQIIGESCLDKRIEETLVSDFDQEDSPRLPLGPLDARALLDRASGPDGDPVDRLSFLLEVDAEEYMLAYAVGRQTEGADDEHDMLHAEALSFGYAHDCTARILGASDDGFVVLYTTDVREALAQNES